MASEPDLLVLLDLRLAGVAEPVDVAERAGIDLGVVERLVAVAEADGLVRRSGGPLRGFRLTADGRTAVGRLLHGESVAAGLLPELRSVYAAFRPLNDTFLGVCTRWQLRHDDGREVLNDHTDRRHDRAVIADLHRCHEGVRPLVDRLAANLERFSGYGPRFDFSLAKVDAGEVDWFTRPGIDSYHAVWFELHANLLATLGIERADEIDERNHDR